MSAQHESLLPTSQQGQLRSNGVIQTEEVAIQVGDILVAENMVTRTRRVITNGITVNESTDRRLIRD
jgi:hypothetical protein